MRHALSLAIVLFAVVNAGARVKVHVDYDRTFDFKPLKVWSWPAEGPGSVKMALSKDDDPEALRKRFEPTIVSEVEQALARKGFTLAAPGQPVDFQVIYFGLVSVSTSAQNIGQFLPGTLEWGIPPFQGATQSLKIYEQGSIVIDVMTPDRRPVWRGIAQAEMHRERPDAQRHKTVREAVDDLLKRFPPRG